MASSPVVDHPVPGTAVVVQATEHDGSLDLVVRGRADAADTAAVDAVTAALRAAGSDRTGIAVQLVVDEPADGPSTWSATLADRLGFAPHRELLQMRRPLPVDPDDAARAGAPPLRLRPFDPVRDAEAWVRTNNRAFATHPSQGAQTLDTLRATLAEPWVDLEGFLVIDDEARPGELAGSCWTRVHPATEDDPVLGEIFVIGVDPSRHGERLGQSLALAGLDHLAWSGVTTGMLYVEADNEPALALYRRLGFAPHLHHRIFTR